MSHINVIAISQLFPLSAPNLISSAAKTSTVTTPPSHFKSWGGGGGGEQENTFSIPATDMN